MVSCAAALLAPPDAISAQPSTAAARPRADTLTLPDAIREARASNAGLRASRDGVAAARGRERQAGGWENPVFRFSREQTSATGAESVQDIAALEQPLDVIGQRAARALVERRSREALELRLQEAQAALAVDVVRAFARAVAAEQRVEQIGRASCRDRVCLAV